MTLAVFELNDSGIGHGSDLDSWKESPGFALLEGNSIATGEKARERAWLEPQLSFHQYWHQLNLSPLSHTNNSARHHADLAYAQLLQLYKDCGEPDEVILAVPGSFTREQLALLLGLAKASPFQAIGLVDSAVAATSQAPQNGPTLHLDIQLHQSVLTRLEGDGEVHRIDVEPLNELGMKGLMDSWAHYIADEFIRQYRYDPLHNASGEQQLYDQLPGWLHALQSSPQTTVSLDTAKGNFRLNLLRDELLANTESRLLRLKRAVAKFRSPRDELYLSHRIARLPGVAEMLEGSRILTDKAVLQGCLANLDRIRSQQEALSFVTRLPVSDKSSATASIACRPAPVTSTEPSPTTTEPAAELPTHALCGHRAVAIGRQLDFCLSNSGLEPCRGANNAEFSLSVNGSGLKLKSREGVDVQAPDPLLPGSVIRLNGEEIRLIQVEQ